MSPVYEEPLIPSKVIYVTIKEYSLVLKNSIKIIVFFFCLKSHMHKDGLGATR